MPELTRALILIPSAFAIAVGCQSAQKQSKFMAVEPNRREAWITLYRSARGGGPNACAGFTKLAADAEFPMTDLARVRAAEACFDAGSELDRATLPPYLKDLGADVALKRARARGDKLAELDLALEISRRKLPQSEKITWVNLALKRATELALPERVAEITRRLHEIAPRFIATPLPRQYLAVAADYRLARDFAGARRFYEKVIAGGTSVENKIAALKGLRFAAKNARQNPEVHLRAARRLTAYLARVQAARSKNPKLRAAAFEAGSYEARALWTGGHPEAAEKIYARLELAMRGQPALAEVYFLRARLAEDRRDHAEVARYLSLAAALKPRDALLDKILWYAAGNERQRGDVAAAVEHLRALEANTTDETVRARALFWLGVSLNDRALKIEANEVFAKLILLDPVGYYGLLAHRALGRPLLLRRAASPAREIAPTMDATLGDWLNALGEPELLAGVVDEAATAYARSTDQTDGAWVDLLQTYGRAGLYLKLFSGLAALTPERRRSVLESHPELLFPRPWPEEVTRAAARFGIDDALIFAIMRQESAFDPKVRSFADAYGLMQLIPEVASRAANQHKIKFTRGEDMFDPAVSIPLGAAHLKELSDRYDGRLILVAAAYNASDAAIRGWVKTRFKGDVLTFIEEIPYEETRTYVRLVLRNLIFYRLLRDEKPMTFPEDLLSVK